MKYSHFFRSIQIILIVSLIASCSTAQTNKKSLSPNVVIILTDDLDFNLIPYMEKTKSLIGDQGSTLTNYFITTPICCPSRSSMLRGQYGHNTDILDNSPAFIRFFKKGEEKETLATWLTTAGYQTSLIGKYLNLYPTNAGKNYVPPGWTDWHAFLYQKAENGGDFYYNYTMNENGALVQYGNTPNEYSTDVIKNKALDFLNKNKSGTQPFFLYLPVYGPHGPSTPAPRHTDLFTTLEYPQKPSFGETDLSDKTDVIRTFASSGDEFDAGDANNLFRERVQTVQAVDELVNDVINTLEKNGQLDNTYIIFTSDNGFHMGEHNFPSGKGTPYEEDIHVPFMIRGPGITPGSQVTQMIANIDVAPTIADMAGASTADFIDGRSFLSLLHPEAGPSIKWRKSLLIEMGYTNSPASSLIQNVSLNEDTANISPSMTEYPDVGQRVPLTLIDGGSNRAVRTENFIYIEYEDGEVEYYDLIADPYQLNNIAPTLDADTLTTLHDWLAKLETCTAENCRVLEETIPATLQGK
ncbi:MAG: sulfatase [Anaerolineales bacterium]